MARKKGGFNRILEFIGLVDDEEPRDTYNDGYQSENYGQRDAYAPQRNRSTPTRESSVSPRRETYAPTRPAYNGRFSTGGNAGTSDGYGRRTSSSYGQTGGYNPYARTGSRTQGADNGANRGSADRSNTRRSFGEAPQQQRRSGGSRGCTVMFTINSLSDCPNVIDSLIKNDTVILTIGNMDVGMKQRSIDTISGAVFALRATIRRASDVTYLIAPKNVEVSDAFDEELDSRYDY